MKIPSLNTLQSIAFTGFITSSVAQAGLLVLKKEVYDFWYVYPVFAIIFFDRHRIALHKFCQWQSRPSPPWSRPRIKSFETKHIFFIEILMAVFLSKNMP